MILIETCIARACLLVFICGGGVSMEASHSSMCLDVSCSQFRISLGATRSCCLHKLYRLFTVHPWLFIAKLAASPIPSDASHGPTGSSTTDEFTGRRPIRREPPGGLHLLAPVKGRVAADAHPVRGLLVQAEDAGGGPARQAGLRAPRRRRGPRHAAQVRHHLAQGPCLHGFTVATRSLHGLGAADHPLLTRRAQHLVPFIEIPGATGGDDRIDLAALPSPRLLATHMPMSLLRPETRSLGCRVVYLCRDPKDTLVSRLHFENKLAARGGGGGLSKDDAFGMFCEGFSPYGPFWDHCREYWEESVARPDAVLFLRYEEIKSEPARVVRRLAGFLGVPLTEEEEGSGVAEEVARMCSFETLTGLEVNQVGGVSHGSRVHVENSVFYRKGEVGDWANHMSREMAEKLDRIVHHKLQGSGLAF